MDLFVIVLIGLLAIFLLSAGVVALGLFGIGAVVYGLALLSQRPLAGLGWIATGVVVCTIVSRVDTRR